MFSFENLMQKTAFVPLSFAHWFSEIDAKKITFVQPLAVKIEEEKNRSSAKNEF